jgi:hypothetical protein
MKKEIICLIIPAFLLGCSKKSEEASPQAAPSQQVSPAAAAAPVQTVVVETPQVKEINDISNQVATLFAAKDYDKIDMLAVQFLASKEQFARGGWKLDAVYVGLCFPQEASNAEWENHIADIRTWIRAKPDSITPRVALADTLIAYAQKARGNGWANSVTEDGARLFSQRLSQASQVLSDAARIKDKCPEYWSAIMTVAMGMGLDKTRYTSIFNHAITNYPDYQQFYATRAQYLLPRWFGSEGEWENDLTISANKIGGEDGDMLYARVVWSIEPFGGISASAKANSLSWERVQKGFEVIQKRFPDSLSAISMRALLASQMGDRNDATKYFEMTQGKIDLAVWHDMDNYNGFTNWLYARKTKW